MTGPADPPVLRLEHLARRLAQLGQLQAAYTVCRVLNTALCFVGGRPAGAPLREQTQLNALRRQLQAAGIKDAA